MPKTSNRFSAIPLDQTHEQENAKVKGVGGVIGLTQNTATLNRWMICGPEISTLFDEFEGGFSNEEEQDIQLHHEEGLASQKTFKKQVQDLVDAITEFGNPFLDDDCPELLILNSRNCADNSVIGTVRSIQSIATAKYQQFCQDVIFDRKISIHESLKKNSLPLFKTPIFKKKSKTSQQLTLQRSNASLFRRLYIANQQREGDLLQFFSHENQTFPPSLSDFGKIRSGEKSLLLKVLNNGDMPDSPKCFDCKIFDGAAVVHFLPTSSVNTFAEYADKIFVPFLQQQLKQSHRLDLVWDRHIDNSIKQAAREQRGHGTRTKVSAQTKMPKK